MKKRIIFKLFFLLTATLFFISCGEDEPDPIDLVPKLDGLYIYGTNTVAESAVDPEAKMARAVLNPTKSGGNDNMEGIYAKLMYIGANSTIQFTEVQGELSFVYGIPGGGVAVPGSKIMNTNITADMISDTLEIDADPIGITDEGLYYVFINLNTMETRIVQVEAEMIGDATEAQWTAGTPLPLKSSSIDSTVFELTDLPLTGSSGYKFTFSSGWEVYIDATMATFTHLGVESYADAWELGINDIGYYEENIPHKDDGIFTVRLKYDASDDSWSETKIKTGALLIDYSATQMGLFGNAYMISDTDTANWNSGVDGYGLHSPEKNGSVYTWTWTAVELLKDREYIYLENGAWGGLQLDWSNFTSVEGQAVNDGDIVDATTLGGEWHNFRVVKAGTYDMSLIIDAAAETKVITIASAK